MSKEEYKQIARLVLMGGVFLLPQSISACAPIEDNCPVMPLQDVGEITYQVVTLEDLFHNPYCFQAESVILQNVPVQFLHTATYPALGSRTRSPWQEPSEIVEDTYQVGVGDTAITFSLQNSDVLPEGNYTIYAAYQASHNSRGSLFVRGLTNLNE